MLKHRDNSGHHTDVYKHSMRISADAGCSAVSDLSNEFDTVIDELDLEDDLRRRLERFVGDLSGEKEGAEAFGGNSIQSFLEELQEEESFENVDIPAEQGRTIADKQEGGSELDFPDTLPFEGRPSTDGGERPSSRFELPDIYRHVRYLDRGGMGELHVVRDEELNRRVAMKIIRKDRVENRTSLVRFVEEAQITAQLDHPPVPPIYDFGRLPDGRLYFTMKVLGEATLSEVVERVHGRFDGDIAQKQWGEWSLRKLIDALHRVCEAVEYAHRCGVVHRDIKPNNILVGLFGEVHLIDWGIARILDRPEPEELAGRPSPQEVETDRDREGIELTSDGSIIGTAGYMAPEQVEGEVDAIGPPADVFSLGALMYEILGGEPAFPGNSHLDVMLKVLKGPARPAVDFEDVPDELGRICDRALATDISERFADAGELRQRLDDWLEGRRQRERADELIDRAVELEEELSRLRRSRRELDDEARLARQQLPPHAPVDTKSEVWDLERRVEAFEHSIARIESEQLQLLNRALSGAPDHPRAHRMLADIFRRRHEQAEAEGDFQDAVEYEDRLEMHDIDGRYADYLRGRGWLSLQTESADVEIHLYRYAQRRRRMGTVFEQSLGESPLEGVELSEGRYLLELTDQQRTVRYPLRIERGGHWRSHREEDEEARPLAIPPAEQFDETVCFIPRGPFISGASERDPKSLPERRLWIDSFWIQRDPVTHREYLAYLNDLVERNEEQEALERAPSRYGGVQQPSGPVAYGRSDSGKFTLDAPQCEEWGLDWPVSLINWSDARSYAEWYAEETGRRWRLPSEFEWEKAARGVDGRDFPWGDHFEPNWCCMVDSRAGSPQPSPVDACGEDVSPYGVRGMAGNVFEWCLDDFTETGRVVDDEPIIEEERSDDPRRLRVYRGGSWLSESYGCSTYHRDGLPARSKLTTVGFRLVAPVTSEE